MSGPLPVVMLVDTGTDDAAALIWAVGRPDIDLVGVLADWGNVDADRATDNTLRVLHAAGADDIPVFQGLGKAAAGPNPARFDASIVMGADGLNGVELPASPRGPEAEPAAEALIRLAREHDGALNLVALSPLTTVARSLHLEPDLPSMLRQVVVMGGAFFEGGNLGAVTEANIGNDPGAAAVVVEAFGRPGALGGGEAPLMVPLDVTHRGTVTPGEIEAAGRAAIPGAGALHRIWEACWKFSILEMGDGLPVHDLLAAWTLVDPAVCDWETLPVAVDTGGSAAWGMTVGDRRLAMIESSPLPAEVRDNIEEMLGFAEARWQVALGMEVDRFRSDIDTWLGRDPEGRADRG
ncbi:MAG TPA: nucleoside hydrolase [Acidimicrobiales bacterium]|nr:nucleoside hydrolase [Acidimicrobiales bacterium]